MSVLTTPTVVPMMPMMPWRNRRDRTPTVVPMMTVMPAMMAMVPMMPTVMAGGDWWARMPTVMATDLHAEGTVADVEPKLLSLGLGGPYGPEQDCRHSHCQ